MSKKRSRKDLEKLHQILQCQAAEAARHEEKSRELNRQLRSQIAVSKAFDVSKIKFYGGGHPMPIEGEEVDIDHLIPPGIDISKVKFYGGGMPVESIQVKDGKVFTTVSRSVEIDLAKLTKSLPIIEKSPPKIRKTQPEKVAELFGFLMSRKSREEYFGNYLSDMKLDRVEKLSKARGPREEKWIEFCFWSRLYYAIACACLCTVLDGVKKIKPLIQWFVG